jgi:hypothetical protein
MERIDCFLREENDSYPLFELFMCTLTHTNNSQGMIMIDRDYFAIFRGQKGEWSGGDSCRGLGSAFEPKRALFDFDSINPRLNQNVERKTAVLP